MEKERKKLSECVLNEGRNLFGEDFLVETMRNSIGEETFYKIILSQILGGSDSFTDIEMYILQTVDGKEVFVCNNGYLRAEALENLKKERKCKVEIRNNRIGCRENYETKLGVWKRINYFSSQNPASIEVFLKELYDLRVSAQEEIRFPNVEIDDFGASVWKLIQDNFNPNTKKTIKVEYYPTFDSKEDIYCDTFIIWLNEEEEEEFFVKLNRFPSHQEFICSNPGQYWRTGDRSTMTTKMRKQYDEAMQEREEKFYKTLHRADRKAVLLLGANERVPYVHVAEVRTSNLKAVEVFLNKLREYKGSYSLVKAIRQDKDYQYRKGVHTNFY